MIGDPQEPDGKSVKRAFRKEFHGGTLFRLWREEDGKGKYLARWAQHRRDVVLSILDEYRLGRSGRTLEVGLGSGILLSELERRGGRTVGADYSRSILDTVRSRQVGSGAPCSGRLCQADVESLPFRDGAFDLAACLGVFEYLEEDRTGMSEFFRILRPGGFLILAVASYHRIGSLSRLAARKIVRRRAQPGAVSSGAGSSLEDRVRMVNPVRLREDAVRAGFDVKVFRCFGGKIRGRYVPLRLFVPGVVYIGDHCVLLLRKPL